MNQLSKDRRCGIHFLIVNLLKANFGFVINVYRNKIDVTPNVKSWSLLAPDH